MDYFYELRMQRGKDILTVEEVLASLDNPIKRVEVFNQLRAMNPQSEELKGIKDFLEANNYDHVKLKAFVAKSENNFDAILERSNKKSSNNTWLKVAAVVIPLIGLAGFLLLNKPDTDLYTNYYEKEVGLPVFMDTEQDKGFNDAMNAYKDNSFKEALTGFDGLLNGQPDNDTLNYFIACTNMEIGDFEQAIEYFETVNESSAFKEKSEYRTALCLLKLEQLPKAKEVLTVITRTKNHRYHDNAVELLKEKPFK